jgi:tetratricopeptide (TPR) repeat protein
MSSASGCTEKRKTTVLSDDVKQEAMMQENEIEELIKKGVNFLNEGKYDDAKSSFEKALSLDKSNKGAYIEIKNRYMEKQRLDDAYYIIKLAISNNVDTDNMTKLLNDIRSRFEVTRLDTEVYQNVQYKLPVKINAKINNEDKEVNVVWSNNTVDTSKSGTVKYQGKIEQYDRSVELYLKVNKLERTRKTGYITKIYEENGKGYLKIDPAEFFMDTVNDRRATIEAKKDGLDESRFSSDGYIYNSYYVRNKDKSVETYEISPKAEVSVCGYLLDGYSSAQVKISYEKLKTLDTSKGWFLCYIDLENKVVVKLQQQFIP